MSSEYGILHIYGQMQWHGDSFIVGNTQGLKALRDAIDRALSDEGKGSMGAYVNDGEGFYTAVVRVDNKDTLDKLAVPYQDEMAKDHRDEAIWPEQMKSVQLAIQEQYDKLIASRTPEQQAACDDSDKAAAMWEEEVKKAQEGGYEPPPPFETTDGAEIWIAQNEQRLRDKAARQRNAQSQ